MVSLCDWLRVMGSCPLIGKSRLLHADSYEYEYDVNNRVVKGNQSLVKKRRDRFCGPVRNVESDIGEPVSREFLMYYVC